MNSFNVLEHSFNISNIFFLPLRLVSSIPLENFACSLLMLEYSICLCCSFMRIKWTKRKVFFSKHFFRPIFTVLVEYKREKKKTLLIDPIFVYTIQITADTCKHGIFSLYYLLHSWWWMRTKNAMAVAVATTTMAKKKRKRKLMKNTPPLALIYLPEFLLLTQNW